MPYFENLLKAQDWLAEIQNPDNGWGLTKGQGASLVNTAEALFVLTRTVRHRESIARGVKYVQDNWENHLVARGARVRYVALPLEVIAGLNFPMYRSLVDSLTGWLIAARNSDGGWGSDGRNESSDMFSTFLAVTALTAARVPLKEYSSASGWVLGKVRSTGWSLKPNESAYSPVATAYAICILNRTKSTDNDPYNHGIQSLVQLQSEFGSDEESDVAGSLWRHSTYSNVLRALAESSDDIFSKSIAGAIRYSNTLLSSQGGWRESVSSDARTVRAQYWAANGVDSVNRAFDPTKYVPRIDAERMSERLKAPEFVHILPQTKYALIVPATLYKGTVAALTLVGALFATGILYPLPSLEYYPHHAAIGGLLFLAALGLAARRRHLFTKRSWVLAGATIGTVEVIHLLLGPSVIDQLHWIKVHLSRIVGILF